MKKEKIIFSLLVSFIILGCSHLNEFGLRRNIMSIDKISPNKNDEAYTIIDTTRLYLLVAIENTMDQNMNEDTQERIKSSPTYLKFYGKGRVGKFTNVNLNDIETLNPKKAESYLYQYKNNKFIVQTYFKNPQCGECFVKKTLSKTTNHQIVLKSGDYIYTYTPVQIPASYLKYKPDW